jgi:thiamine biosynthesis protein ThiS
VKVTVNGRNMEVKEGMNLLDFILFCKVRPDTAIVELNEKVVSKNFWADTMLKVDDRVELVTLVGGG